MAADAVVGYDPGGDGAHGVAMLVLLDGKAVEIYTGTWDYAEEVIAWIKKLDVLSALGVDTLTCWSTGPAAWRPADRWLRRTYPEVRNSVMTPNGLAGSMGLNGMGVIIETRALFPGAAVVETHPKVLHWALSGRRYAQSTRDVRDQMLSDALGIRVDTENDHEWDAAFSAYAAAMGLKGHWPIDLHTLPLCPPERLVSPAGKTNYFWPSLNATG